MSNANALAIPNPPKQKRSRERVAVIRRAAEKIILNESMDACSIAALAEATGYPRTTIYMFYPGPLALFNDLAAMHLNNMQAAIRDKAELIAAAPDWRKVTERVFDVAAGYFQKNPVAARLVLGPLTDSSHRSWEDTIKSLGKQMDAMLKARGVILRHSDTDACALAMEFGAASFRFSYFVHGSVTPAYVKAGFEAIVAFLGGYIVSESE